MACGGDRAGRLRGRRGPPVFAASIEAHLLACAGCREQLARSPQPKRAEPGTGWPTRSTGRVPRVDRLPGGHWLARSTIATPAMLWSALAAVVLVGLVPLATALMAADAGLLTLLIVGAARPGRRRRHRLPRLVRSRRRDVAGHANRRAAPGGHARAGRRRWPRCRSPSRCSGPLTPGSTRPDDVVAAWCLPGLALAALVLLAGTTRVDPVVVAAVVSAGWGFAAATRRDRPAHAAPRDLHRHHRQPRLPSRGPGGRACSAAAHCGPT